MNEEFLICLGAPPRFYPQAVTLIEGAFESLNGRINGVFKDSFHDAEPDPSDYRLLFSAQWIWKEPSEAPRTSLRWTKVESDVELQKWEECWAKGDPEAAGFPRQFPASLLEHDDLSFFSAWNDGGIAGGVLLNVPPPVVGISNAFGLALEESALWADIVALACSHFPSMPLTGYERGPSLDAAIRAGFEPLGPLRVWVPS